jgi:hypothetical protein
VVTHRDLLRKLSDPQKVLARLRRDASSPFRDIVLVSTGDALAVMGQENMGLAGLTWKVSGAEALEVALDELLLGVRERRAATALEMTSRVAYRALSKVE